MVPISLLSNDGARLASLQNSLINQRSKDSIKSDWKHIEAVLKSIEDYDKLIEKSISDYRLYSHVTAYLIHKKGTCFYRKGAFQNALQEIDQAIVIREQLIPLPISDIANGYFTKGAINKHLENKQGQVESFHAALQLYISINDLKGIIKCHHRIGNYYWKLENDFEMGERHLQIAKSKENKIESPRNYTKVLSDLGKLFNKKKEFDKAMPHLIESLNVFYSLKDSIELSRTYNSIGRNLEEQELYEEALSQYLEANRLEVKSLKNKASIQESIGTSYMELGKLELAKKWLFQSLDLRKTHYKKEFHISYTNSYHNLGVLFTKQKQFKEGLSYYQKAITNYSANYRDTSIYSNIDPGLIIEGSLEDLVKDYQFKTNAFWQWYKESRKEPKHLDAAYESAKTYSALLERMLNEFHSSGTQLFMLKEYYPATEITLEIAYEKWLLEKDKNEKKEYEEFVFSIIERNKSIVLLNSLKNNKTYKKQTAEFSKLNKDIKDLKSKLKNQPDDPKIKEQILEKEIALTTIKKQLKKSDNSTFYSLADIQSKLLTPKRALLNYFVGDSTVYLMASTRNKQQLFTIPINNLSEQVKQIIEITKDDASDTDTFQLPAYQVYRALLQPATVFLPSTVEELIILPDGFLSYLPFEVLLTEAAKPNSNWKTVSENMLGLKKAITYGYSASVLMEYTTQQPTTDHTYPLAAFAPTFNALQTSATRNYCLGEVSNLAHNSEEAATVSSHFKGKSFLASEADKATLFQRLKDTRILHLATHACVDTDQLEEGQLFMADSVPVYFHELYDVDTKTEMVVLSACETGSGMARRGEGVFSLARAFAQSGIPSTTMSLWAVDDRATMEVMGYYYKHLAAGKAKHLALKRAKRDYLDSIESLDKAHPYYWAGFVHYGDFGEVSTENSLTSVLLFMFLLLFVFLVFVVIRNVKKNRKILLPISMNS